MVAKPDSTPRGKKDDGKSIKLLSLASDGVTSLPLDDDRSLLYETESVLLLDPKTNRAFLWTGRESSLESEKLQTRIAELTSGEVVRCVQGMESREFVELLGGRLVVRQVRPCLLTPCRASVLISVSIGIERAVRCER